jgi:hypothetical protein
MQISLNAQISGGADPSMFGQGLWQQVMGKHHHHHHCDKKDQGDSQNGQQCQNSDIQKIEQELQQIENQLQSMQSGQSQCASNQGQSGSSGFGDMLGSVAKLAIGMFL